MNKQQFIEWLDSDVRYPAVMGILNVTTESFYDGGCYRTVNLALKRAHQMIAEGADMLDIGGESSRPGARSISDHEELDRVIPVIEAIRSESDICISIDTCKPIVMQEAIRAGATWINDIMALRLPGALEVAAATDVPVCLMHMQGLPQTMQQSPQYDDLIEDINAFFVERIQSCLDAGISRRRLILDPGFGFGKTTEHNLLLTKKMNQFCKHGRPILLGFSRKKTIGDILEKPIDGRLVGGLAFVAYALIEGVSIIRTHDVWQTKQLLSVVECIKSAG